jgi:restriction system protein
MSKQQTDITIWGIHAGRTGDADHLFLKQNFVAIGWHDMKDLSKIPADREAFKKRVAEVYPDAKPGAIPNYAGQTYRFVHELKEGDIIVYPSKRDHKIHIGKIKGKYRYDPSLEDSYPNLRPVDWLKTLPRTDFSQAALYEIGSAMSLFQVRNYADEFLAALTEKVQPVSLKDDQTVGIVADTIEQTTKDFILKQLSTELKGYPFQDFIAHLFQVMGYHTRKSPKGSDKQIDIIAHKDELGFEPPIIKIQVKSQDGSVGDPEVSALYGKVSQNEFGLFITLSNFTNQAKNFALNKSNLRLIDNEELIKLILEHYEKFDSRYKGLIPLKRVYIPEALEEGDNE